jgi:hypothetical protein
LATSDACALVSLSAMSRIVGTTVALQNEQSDNGGSSCVYQLTGEGPLITISLLNGDWGAIQSEFDNAPEAAVPDLGRSAFWSQREHALHVHLTNGVVMRISLDRREAGWKGPELKSLAVQIASQALKPSPPKSNG